MPAEVVESLLLEILRTQPDAALSHLLYVTMLKQRVGLDDLQRSLTPFCDFKSSI